jgi:hypothetical protein
MSSKRRRHFGGPEKVAVLKRHRDEKHWVLGLEFKTFVNTFARIPCQIVRTGRRLVYRLLSWNPHQRIFFRMVSALQC